MKPRGRGARTDYTAPLKHSEEKARTDDSAVNSSGVLPDDGVVIEPAEIAIAYCIL